MKLVYIGQKAKKTDATYGTGEWLPGEPRDVADDLAAKMTRLHPDVWVDFDNWRNADGLVGAGKGDDPDRLAELRAALTAKGITFHHKAGVEKLAKLLAESGAES